MATKHARLICIVLLVVLPATVSLMEGGRGARADDSVPTATSVPVTPDATEAPPTVPPPATEAPPPPTVTEEQSTPIPTSPPVVVQEPSPLPTLAPARETTVHPRPVPVRHVENSVPSPTSLVVPAVTAPPSEPLPSPAELRMNARLRWGTRVPAQVRRWAFLIVPAARKYGLDPDLIAAVMTMESNGDPLALSGADARGLMQILHGPWNPRTNVYTGARMLAGLLAQFHDLRLALAAYNAGPDAVVSYNGVPPYRETRDYVIIVQYLYDLYSHHRLTVHRKAQYRKTLKDLQRFADQRKKIPDLARVAHLIPDKTLNCRHYSPFCLQQARDLLSGTSPSGSITTSLRPAPLFPTLDPFWPVGGVPDPLQRVDPIPQRGG